MLELARQQDRPFTVLGADGFIGSHMGAFLRAHDLPALLVGRDGGPLDARDLGHVFYAVGLTNDFSKRPFDTVEAHVVVLQRILQQGRFASLVYLSSTRLYDSCGGRGTEDQALLLDPRNPRHLFDFSKGLGEALCLHASTCARVARLSSVYSKDLDSPNFLHAMVRQAAEGAPSIDTSPDTARDFVDVDDVCEFLLAIALRGRRPIYNVASGENVSNAEICEWLGAVRGEPLVPARPASGETVPRIDISAIVGDFGSSPRRVRDALSAMFAKAQGGR
jgi:nucleoside-diphosphate-sugar epimerase